jgi:ketosteroid isomerase-like protein
MDFISEKKHLLERDAEWAEAASQGKDIDLILSYWTDDAIVMPQGFPSVVGKEEVRRYVENSLQIPGFKISWTSSDAAFSPDGNLAYMFSQNEVAIDDENGNPLTSKGRAVTIWRREADGEWRCAVDIWNAEN